jgi:hypothetical protein
MFFNLILDFLCGRNYILSVELMMFNFFKGVVMMKIYIVIRINGYTREFEKAFRTESEAEIYAEFLNDKYDEKCTDIEIHLI